MITIYYFINLLEVHLGIYNRACFITGQHIAETVYIFIFCLSERPFLGFAGKAAAPPIHLRPPSGVDGI